MGGMLFASLDVYPLEVQSKFGTSMRAMRAHCMVLKVKPPRGRGWPQVVRSQFPRWRIPSRNTPFRLVHIGYTSYEIATNVTHQGSLTCFVTL